MQNHSINHLNATLNDFSPSRSNQLSFDACFYRDAPNVHARVLFSAGPKINFNLSNLALDVNLSGLDIARLKGISPQMKDASFLNDISGVAHLILAHLDIGTATGLSASGEFNITDGQIKNFNIMKMLLSHTLNVFGGIEINFNNLYSGPLKSVLGAQDTMIEKAQAQFSLHDHVIYLEDSLIQTNLFEFSAIKL